MLFNRAASSNLFKSAFRRMNKSTSAKEVATEAESAAAGGLVAAVATTFGTYMCADFLSNFIQHPTQKVRTSIFYADPVFFVWYGNLFLEESLCSEKTSRRPFLSHLCLSLFVVLPM